MDQKVVKKIREFNRYYTVWLDVFTKGYLGTDLSWPESRTLFEIWRFPGIHAAELCAHLHMDKGYISRMIAKFEKNGILTRELVVGSKGIKRLWLTEAGVEKAKQIDANGDKQIIDKLKNMDAQKCQKLCEAMQWIERILREHEQ